MTTTGEPYTMLRTINPNEFNRWVDTIQTDLMPLTEDELDLANQDKRHTIDRMLRQRTGASAGTWRPACGSDACCEGRMPCPTPYSCMVPVDGATPRPRRPLTRAQRVRRAVGTVLVMAASASITIWLLAQLAAGVAP